MTEEIKTFQNSFNKTGAGAEQWIMNAINGILLVKAIANIIIWHKSIEVV